jgi:small GTP-binding protein
MINKKICMLGASGVGKTSLVQRFVRSIYSGKYHMTIGVKIDKKQVTVNGQDVTLMLWDLQGEDGDFQIRPSFLRGASGYFLVIDSTRHETLINAFAIQKMIETEIGNGIPFVVLFNKSDLVDEIQISNDEISDFENQGWTILRTSAKTGEMVEESFIEITKKILTNS